MEKGLGILSWCHLSSRLEMITAWLNARPDVENFEVGEEFDLWHGDFQDIGEN